MPLVLDHVSCGYTHQPVLTDASLTVEAGEFVCLLGPNGSGKSVLLKTLAGILRPLRGRILLAGREWSEWTAPERAARIAYVPQAHAPLFAFRVLDVVAMARTARWPLWSGPTRADWRAAEAALAAVEMSAFAERRYTELSGGERQMVLLARALAQEARFLVLDEPASSLDFGNQVRVLQTLRRLVREGLGVLMATHHPEHALRCATRVAVVGDGRLEPATAPAVVLTAERLEAIYRVPFVLVELRDRAGQTFSLCAPHLD
jgi:iron complex transport system ATP-binding protein